MTDWDRVKELKQWIGEALQELEDVLQGKPDLLERWLDEEMRIRFPGGVIRTVQSVKEGVPFFEVEGNEVLAANVAYHLQWADVLEWLLFRLNLEFSAASMACKMGIVAYAHIAAGMAVAFLRWYQAVTGESVKALESTKMDFGQLLGFLWKQVFHSSGYRAKKVKKLKKSLEDLWETRNRIHVENSRLVAEKEYREYEREDFLHAKETVMHFLEVLKEVCQIL